MSVKIADVAEKVGMKPKELKEKIKELGFDVKDRARTLEDDVAELIIDELTEESTAVDPENADTKEIYEAIYDEQADREIIKKQRKKMAGKDSGNKDKHKEDEVKPEPILKGKSIEIPEVISVKEFAEKTGITAAKVIGQLMKNGILANINQQIDFDTATIIASDFQIKLKKIRDEASVEDLVTGDLLSLLKEGDPADLVVRPPIISVMGHVDHGKTKLLDYIRNANVIDTEAGGITQHIGAYQVTKNEKKITFLDTPGHEAFSLMRARGAKATDIAILVVAADEGVKPQTLEAMNHAIEADIPIIVAINKIDKENANPDKVKAELAEAGLQPEDWGGKTIMTPVSAITGEGVDTLLEMILLVAEMQNLKSNPKRPAVASVIEAHLDKNLGPVATILVNTGTLRVMDNIVLGPNYGRIKVMKDHHAKPLKEAPPSTPVFIAGLSATPQAGDILQVVKDEKTARTKAMQIETLKRSKYEQQGVKENIISQITTGKLTTLKLVLKADVNGTLEAITQALAKVKNDEVAIKVIHSGVGNITETDVMMASASGGIVIGFNSDANAQVTKLTERENVEILKYSIIYKLIDDMKNLLNGLIEPEIVEVVLGKMEVRQIFFSKKKEMIIGCKVTNGKIQNNAKVRVFREEKLLGEAEIISLKKVNEKINEIKEGNECGIKLARFDDPIQEGDVLEAYTEETKLRTIE